MAGDFFRGDAGKKRMRPLARAAGFRVLPLDRDFDRRQRQAALPPAHQFQIDLRGELGVEQRAMLGRGR